MKIVSLHGVTVGSVEGLSLDQTATEITTEITAIDAVEAKTASEIMDHWFRIGVLLLHGKTLTADPTCGIAGDTPDQRFGKWKAGQSSKLEECHPADPAAAIWAADDPETFAALRKVHPNVRTVRGLHAKWLADQKPKLKPQPKPGPAPSPATAAQQTPQPALQAVPVVIAAAISQPTAQPAPEAPLGAAPAKADPAGIQLGDAGDEAALRARQKEILAVIVAYGPDGVSRETLIASGAGWATKKHIDTNMVPLFRRALIIATADDHFVAREVILGGPVDPETLGETGKAKLARALKQQQAKLDASFNVRVQAAVDLFIAKTYNTILIDRMKVIKAKLDKPALLSESDFKMIRSCLHPDNAMSTEKRASAFAAFTALAIHISPAEREKTKDGLPKTFEDFLAGLSKKPKKGAGA